MYTNLTKQRIGLPCIDDTFSGVYTNHRVLITGAKNEGRERAMMQILRCYDQMNDSTLLISSTDIDSLALMASEIDFDLTAAVNRKSLTIIRPPEYTPTQGLLPVAESISEILESARNVEASHIVFEDVRQWLEAQPVEDGERRAKELVTQLRTGNSTSILMLPEPVSEAAKRVCEALRDCVSISMNFRLHSDNDSYWLDVVTYRGFTKRTLPISEHLIFEPNKGLTLFSQQTAHEMKNSQRSQTIGHAAGGRLISAASSAPVDLSACLSFSAKKAKLSLGPIPTIAPPTVAVPSPIPLSMPMPKTIGQPAPVAVPSPPAPSAPPPASPTVVPFDTPMPRRQRSKYSFASVIK